MMLNASCPKAWDEELVFKDKTRYWCAASLAESLGKLAEIGIDYVGNNNLTPKEKDELLQRLEASAATVMREVIDTLLLKKNSALRVMDEETVWRLYRAMRNEPAAVGISLFELLAFLDNTSISGLSLSK